MATACEKEELSTEIDYYIHNESFEERKAVLRVRLIDRDFHTLYETERQRRYRPFEVKERAPWTSPLPGRGQDEKEGGGGIPSDRGWLYSKPRNTLFVKPKYFDFKTPEYRFL